MTTNRPRTRAASTIVLVAALLTVIGCTQAVPLTSPPVSAVPSPSPSPTTTPTAAPTATASPAPTSPPSPSPTPASTPCPIVATDGTLPSDRLIDVEASSGAGADRFMFRFGNSSIGSPAGIPTGELTLAEPPYTFGPSGLPIEMTGERVLQVVFRRMSLSADTGQPVYQGPVELRPDLSSLRHAVEFDESEGVIGWYLGFDGSACVALTRAGNDVVVTFEHR